MSGVKRYKVRDAMADGETLAITGNVVLASDYDAMAQRCRELEAENNTFNAERLRVGKENATLRDENVRLAEWYSEAGIREDTLRAEVADIMAELGEAEGRANNAGRNASAFEDRMGDLQVEGGKLRDEIADLKARLLEAERGAEDLVSLRAEIRELKARPEQGLVSMLGRRLFESDAVNYIETSFTSDDYPGQGEIVVTLRRAAGKTPHELRMDAECHRDELLAEVEALRKDAERVNWLAEQQDSAKVPRELLEQAATWLEVHAPGGGCIEGSVADELRTLLAGGDV